MDPDAAPVWTRMPPGVARAQLLCYLAVAAFALALIGAIGFVLELHGGDRMRGVAWSAFAATMAGLMLLTAQALGRGRRWSWAAGLGACLRTFRTLMTPESKHWFGR